MKPVREKPEWPAGTVIRIPHVSKVLADNPWQDPVARELPVYLPARYDENAAPYVALWDFAAFTNSGPGHLNWRHQGESLVQRLDRLIGRGDMPPVVVPMPDCYTSLGGNQYINSTAVGRYADYVLEELLPLLAEHVNVFPGRDGRGVFGKSSGGYGGLIHAMRHPESWGAVAAHAPDCGFELVYQPEFPAACLALEEFDGEPRRFLEAFWKRRQPGRRDYAALMVIAMAASYDPDPGHPGGFHLPFDLRTCALDPERWSRWAEHDPLRMVDSRADALRTLHCLYLDAGNRDQYNIQFGVRALAARLENLDVAHHFEEFDGNHTGLDWRLDYSLPTLARELARASGN